jgi:hypothetical protein
MEEPLDSSSIELIGSNIANVEIADDSIKVNFAPAYIIKTMTGSVERTKWIQNGTLLFEKARLIGALPVLPAECTGGDVGENIYTYRDMIPLPLASQGCARCQLKVANSDRNIHIEASSVRLIMEEPAKYIEHIRPR